MDCKKIQELILTDYCDKEIDEATEKLITQHTNECRQCREFFGAVEQTTQAPFIHGYRQPPAYIWNRIQDALIEKKMQESEVQDSVWEKCKRFLSFRQPFLGWGSAFALVLMLAVAIGMNMPVQHNGAMDKQEQFEYLAYVTNDTPEAVERQAAGFGTPIEEYFL